MPYSSMNQPESSVKVIGAGWGRTGTKSLYEALNILGCGPTYHMVEVGKNKHSQFWIRVADGGSIDFDEAFNGENKYHSTCDFPSAVYWKQQLQKYPNAKVILTIRDPEKWFASCSSTIFRVMMDSEFLDFGVFLSAKLLQMPSAPFREMISKVIGRDSFKNDWSKENIIRRFNEHNEECIRDCPRDRLLVFEVSQGWEPLCKFLDKPIPDVPFPHVNDTKLFQEQIVGTMSRKGYMAAFRSALAVGGTLFVAWWICRDGKACECLGKR